MSDICKQDTDRVLLVEGVDDCHVIMALCAAHQVPQTFGIYECGGDTKLLKRLNALIVRPNPPVTIGVILDADTSLLARWSGIRDKLKAHQYVFPEVPDVNGTIVAGFLEGVKNYPKLGFWLMPNNREAGKLEDFCIEMAESRSLEFARECVHEARSRKLTTFTESDDSKAIVHTYLAWQDEPGRPLGQSIAKKALSSETAIARQVSDWLTRLFS